MEGEPRAVDLGPGPSPFRVVNGFADDRGLVALAGRWAGGGALLLSEPIKTLGPDDDVFAVLDGVPAPGTAGEVVGGGWFGYLGYRLGRELERLPPEPPRPVPVPPAELSLYDHLLRFDANRGRWSFEMLWTPARADALAARLELLQSRLCAPAARDDFTVGCFTATPDRNGHLAAVDQCVTSIRAG